jgi:cobaltochelatase CobS
MVKAHASAAQIDENLLRRLVAEAVSAATPGKIILNPDSTKPVQLTERTHPLFEKALRLARVPGINLLLVGPAGCGKTYLAAQLAKALKRSYGTLHCTSGASESQLTGWLLPIGKTGQFKYVPSEFVALYEAGSSVFLLDEIDAADPNMLLVLNGAMANGELHVPQRYENPHVARGKNVTIIAAANTFGTGADMLYAGRNQLDGATLDRFYVLQMDYDAALEAEITGTPLAESVRKWEAAAAPTQEELAELATWCSNLRKSVAANRLRRVVSTRTVMKAMAARKAGIPSAEVKRDLLAGWTRDELAKVEVM